MVNILANKISLPQGQGYTEGAVAVFSFPNTALASKCRDLKTVT